jgi:hypothetical protein
VADVVVASLLPQHLSNLGGRRQIRFAGSTLTISAVYDAISYVLEQAIDIQYHPVEALDTLDKPVKEEGCAKKTNQDSFLRSFGSGGFDVGEATEVAASGKIVFSSNKDYLELVPKTWAEVVHSHFKVRGSKGERGAQSPHI